MAGGTTPDFRWEFGVGVSNQFSVREKHQTSTGHRRKYWSPAIKERVKAPANPLVWGQDIAKKKRTDSINEKQRKIHQRGGKDIHGYSRVGCQGVSAVGGL